MQDDVGGTSSAYGRRVIHKINLVGELEGKRLLTRSRHRWEDNTRMDLIDIGWKCAD
jgi:hypothetical protein